MTDKRLILVDPGFCAAAGHHLATFQHLSHICRKHNVAYHVHASRDLGYLPDEDAARVAAVPWLASFHCDLSDVLYHPVYAGRAKSFEGMLAMGELLAADLTAGVGTAFSPNDTVFFHTGNATIIHALCQWLGGFAGGHDVRAVLHVLAVEDDALCAAQYTHALKEAEAFPNLRILGSSRPVCSLLRSWSGKEHDYLPTPLPALAPRVRPTAPYPLFGVVGEARLTKNFEILPKAIGRYLNKKGKGRFLINLHRRDNTLDDVLEQLAFFRHKFPDNIELRLRPLYGEPYYEQIRRCDALLLPYSPEMYAIKPTFIIFEAAVLGVSSIVQTGTSMEEELRALDNGSAFMAGGGASDLADAMLEFEKNLEERRDAALAAAAPCRAVHNPETYFSLIMGT